MLVSEVCVILHNLLIRMRQYGALNDEMEEDDVQFGIICQSVEQETVRLLQRGQERSRAPTALDSILRRVMSRDRETTSALLSHRCAYLK